MVGQAGAHQVMPVSWQRVWRSQLEVAALDTAPGCLRLHARHVLGAWSLEDLSDTVELLVSELATNAVQAAEKVSGPPWAAGPSPQRQCVELRLTLTDYTLVIEVWDACPAPPQQAGLPDAGALSGRGLFLVQELSQRWGSTTRPRRAAATRALSTGSAPHPGPFPASCVRSPARSSGASS